VHATVGDLYGPAPAMTAIDAPLGWPILLAQVIANQAQWPDAAERIACAAIRANRVLGRLERASNVTRKQTIPPADRALASVEGWIHVPARADTLEKLVGLTRGRPRG
jgi:hypothetical protein